MVGILGLGDISSAASQRITAKITRAVSAHHAWVQAFKDHAGVGAFTNLVGFRLRLQTVGRNLAKWAAARLSRARSWQAVVVLHDR
jgi:hypothetical protein